MTNVERSQMRGSATTGGLCRWSAGAIRIRYTAIIGLGLTCGIGLGTTPVGRNPAARRSGLADCSCAAAASMVTVAYSAPSGTVQPKGGREQIEAVLPRTHDPAIAKERGVYYLFATGSG